jgi:hypothetical protein
MKIFPKTVIFRQVQGTKKRKSLVWSNKIFIRPISFLSKLENQQELIRNIYLQRVPFCAYLGEHPSRIVVTT